MNSSEKKTTPKHWNVKNAAIPRKLVSQNKWKRHIHLKKCYTGSSGLPQIIPNMAHKPALKTENKTFCWLGWKQTVRLDEERRWRKYSLWEQEYRRCRRPEKTRQKISQSSKQPSHTASGLRVNTHTHTHTYRGSAGSTVGLFSPDRRLIYNRRRPDVTKTHCRIHFDFFRQKQTELWAAAKT